MIQDSCCALSLFGTAGLCETGLKTRAEAAECARGKWAALYKHSKTLAHFITKPLIITKLLSLYLTTELSSWYKHSLKTSLQKLPVFAMKRTNTSKAF